MTRSFFCFGYLRLLATLITLQVTAGTSIGFCGDRRASGYERSPTWARTRIYSSAETTGPQVTIVFEESSKINGSVAILSFKDKSGRMITERYDSVDYFFPNGDREKNLQLRFVTAEVPAYIQIRVNPETESEQAWDPTKGDFVSYPTVKELREFGVKAYPRTITGSAFEIIGGLGAAEITLVQSEVIQARPLSLFKDPPSTPILLKLKSDQGYSSPQSAGTGPDSSGNFRGPPPKRTPLLCRRYFGTAD